MSEKTDERLAIMYTMWIIMDIADTKGSLRIIILISSNAVY